MKIYIINDDDKKITIPIPMWVLKMGTGKVIVKYINNHIKNKYNKEDKHIADIEEKAKYIEKIDFAKFKTSINLLNEYKGLKIFEYKRENGSKVKVIV